MNSFIIGTSAYPTADHNLMKEGGIGWVRQGFPFPFADRVGSSLAQRYVKAKERSKAWRDKGFNVMGITPLFGGEKYKEDANGVLVPVWNSRAPLWMGSPGSGEFLNNYRNVCTFLAKDLKGIVGMWQIANEMDAKKFSGPLGLRRACQLILASAESLKEADDSLVVGTNTAGIDKSYYFYGRLYSDPEYSHYLDYCGVDQYFGTWQNGGPANWDPLIAELHDVTEKEILVNEWGYSSSGQIMNEEEKQLASLGSYYNVCMFKKWPFVWNRAHSPEVQAEYILEAFKMFRRHRDKVIGMFYYRWEDQETCWGCGAKDCPAETAYGLVTVAGQPKPGYAAFKEGVQHFLS